MSRTQRCTTIVCLAAMLACGQTPDETSGGFGGASGSAALTVPDARPDVPVGQVEVSPAVQHDVSPPLRDIPSAPSARNLTERPLRRVPGPPSGPTDAATLQVAPGTAV